MTNLIFLYRKSRLAWGGGSFLTVFPQWGPT